jgi:hypothetical protein
MRIAWVLSAAVPALVLAPGQAAAANQNPLVVIEQLEAAGYAVTVDRIGNAPIEECTVTDVRNPQQVVEPVRIIDRDGHRGVDVDTIDVVVHQSISVSLDCTG